MVRCDACGYEEFVMPWAGSPALMKAGADSVLITIDADLFTFASPFSYKLFDVLGAPSHPIVATINISSEVNLGTLWIDERFNESSQFTINLTNDGRVVGRGGMGGRGGFAESEPGFSFNIAGQPGRAAGSELDGSLLDAAIISAFDFSLDTDDGFVLGGGGGGGGGGADDGQTAAGGGGGGQGWNVAAGGQAGLSIGDAQSGGAGSLGAAGLGGAGGLNASVGGAGGGWGEAGTAGTDSPTPSEGTQGAGGAKGFAIKGFPSAITVDLTGAKSEATLNTENRLEGGTSGVTFI